MRQLLISRHFDADSLYVIYNGVAISSERPPLNREEFFEKSDFPWNRIPWCSALRPGCRR